MQVTSVSSFVMVRIFSRLTLAYFIEGSHSSSSFPFHIRTSLDE